jgi:predicted DNA-binding transcriptional regulator AlpA
MIVEEHIPVTEVAKTLGVSRSTIYRHVPLEQEPAG